MGYFISHIKIIFFASLFIAFIAFLWQFSVYKNAEIKKREAMNKKKAKKD